MPSIPLPFVVSLVLCIVLLRMMRQGEERFGLFALLVAALAVQGVLSGLNWSVGWHPTRVLQPVLAAVLPGLAFAAFDGLKRGAAAGPSDLWLHLMPAGLVAFLVALWREPVDLVLFGIYLGYGLAVLRAAGRGPGALAAARLGDERTAHRALVAVGLLLVANAVIDAAISLDLAFGDGRQAMAILTAGSVLWLAVAGYAATVADASRPAPDGEPVAAEPAAKLPTSEDAAILQRIEALMSGQHLFRDPDLTLERLARRAGIPARQISGALNRIHGRNVSQVVNEYRVAEARRRLVATREPITTVMLESGFGTKSNFNREFLRVTGMSPSAYRRAGGAPATDGAGEAPAAS